MIDTDGTDEITCPYCGYEFTESYEFPGEAGGSEGNIGPIDCDDCGRRFNAYRNVSISYSTEKIKE